MEHDPKTPQYNTNDRTSFAYVSARDRWPVILHQAFDDVFRTNKDNTDPAVVQEGKKIIEQFLKLKYELQHDRVMTPLEEDGEEDIKHYNEELEKLGNPKWFEAPWLFTECYLYRRVNTFFTKTQHWKSYDIFARQKTSTFRSSLPAVLELATRYRSLFSDKSAIHDPTHTPEERAEAEKLLFVEFFEVCLWGNATDLSLLTSLTYEDIQKLQGSEARKASEKNILVNDLGKAYDVLKEAEKKGGERRVDIVLDNAGFELYVDLILAGYLLETKLATTVVLHPKSLPWFVSDVLVEDFGALLGALADPAKFFNTPEDDKETKEKISLTEEQVDVLKFLFSNFAGHHGEGGLVIRPNRFWTTADSYWRLPYTAPELFEDLKESELVVFKGDLNYRKLTADAAWDPTTPFEEAIGPLGKNGSGMRTLALRTCKADVVVGLKPGLDEELKAGTVERKWGWSGKYAVVQFWDGKAE